MADPSITDWFIAGGTTAAALAAIVAAISTKCAADAAAKAAKAAAQQVELQRPRPIVLAEFVYSSSSNTPPDRHFRLKNIGNSPAFDIDVTPIETPGPVPTLGAPGRLETTRTPYVLPDTPAGCTHQLYPETEGVPLQGPASRFVDYAKTLFAKADDPLNVRHEIDFSLSYRALDGRRFEQPYIFVVYFATASAWIEPVGSLLETSVHI